MKQKRLVAALLTLVLLAGLTGCARKSRRPALPAAPLQSTFKQDEADLGQGETASLQSAPVMKREASRHCAGNGARADNRRAAGGIFAAD